MSSGSRNTGRNEVVQSNNKIQGWINKYNQRPDDFRFGLSLAFFAYSALCFLKPRFVPIVIAHPNVAMATSLGFGASYLYSSRLYYSGYYENSHQLSFVTSTVATLLSLMIGFFKGRKMWYLYSIFPAFWATRDLDLYKQSIGTVPLFQKEPVNIQRAHPVSKTGPYKDMPDEKIVENVHPDKDSTIASESSKRDKF